MGRTIRRLVAMAVIVFALFGMLSGGGAQADVKCSKSPLGTICRGFNGAFGLVYLSIHNGNRYQVLAVVASYGQTGASVTTKQANVTGAVACINGKYYVFASAGPLVLFPKTPIPC